MQQLRLRDLLPENVSVYNIQDRNFRFQHSVSGRCLCAEPRSAELSVCKTTLSGISVCGMSVQKMSVCEVPV